MTQNFKSYGYYEYDNRAYLDKSAALDTALANHDYYPKIHYNFHDHVFDHIDWCQDPDITITDLYSQRAQQLRDEYDMLILMYTGGSDSRQVLSSFLDHNIFLDEVVTVHPVKLTESMVVTPDPNHANSFLFEYNLTTVPGLQDLAVRSPKTKITVVDMSDDLMCHYADDVYFEDHQPCSHIGGIYHSIKTNSGQQHARRSAEGRGRVAVIYGCDKPNVVVRDEVLYHYFTDCGLTGSQSQRHRNQVNFDPVLFFTSADCPLIPVKQSHLILHTLRQQSHVRGWYQKLTATAKGQDHAREITKHIIYPSWHSGIYQGNKSAHFSFDDCKVWYDSIDPKIAQAQQSRKQSFLAQYQQLKTLEPNHVYMMRCQSKYRRIGTIKGD